MQANSAKANAKKPDQQAQQSSNSGNQICGHTFQTYLNNFVFTSEEASESNKSMYLNIRQNNFVRFKDSSKRTIQIKSKLPQPTFSNTIQSNIPIDIRQEIFYFEMKILNCGTRNLLMIGISDKDFQLNKQLGTAKKSYGYKADGKVYNGKTTGEDYGPKFERLDVVGCGIIMSRKQIFYTYNGRFLGTAASNIEIQRDQLFASVCLQSINEEVQVNFSGSTQEQFIFDLEGFKNDIAQAEFLEINKMKIKKTSLHELVKSYLIHYAYVETLQAVEEETSQQDDISLQVMQSQFLQQEEGNNNNNEEKKLDTRPEVRIQECSGRIATEEDKMSEGLNLGRQVSLMSDASAEEYVNDLIKRTNRAESVHVYETQSSDSHIGGLSSQLIAGIQKRPTRSGSLYIPPRISEFVIEKSEKFIKTDSVIYLKERGILRYMIMGGQIDEARMLLQEKFKSLYESNAIIQGYLDALQFINIIEEGNIEHALEFSATNLHKYKDPQFKVKIPTKNALNQETEIDIKDITALLCYEDPKTSDLSFLLSDNQKQMVADKLNNEILRYGNKRKGEPSSHLENVFKQLQLCQESVVEFNSHSGKQFRLSI